jgi:hypothetical protein
MKPKNRARLIHHTEDECTVVRGWRTWYFRRKSAGYWLRITDQGKRHPDQKIPEAVRELLPEE